MKIVKNIESHSRGAPPQIIQNVTIRKKVDSAKIIGSAFYDILNTFLNWIVSQ